MLIKIKMKEKNLIVLLGLIQIFLMINTVPSNSYLVSGSNFLGENIARENNFDEILDVGLDFLISLISIKQIGSVSAVEEVSQCCIEFQDGVGSSSCQNVAAGTSCGDGLASPEYNICSEVDSCRPGTCIDEDLGICDENVPRKTCEENEGEWDSRATDDIAECRSGCCILGSETAYTTSTNCGILAGNYGIPKVFDSGLNFNQCAGYVTTLEKGACMVDEENCRLVPGVDCQQMRGTFFQGILCTNPELYPDPEKPTCKPTDESMCSPFQNDYNVYFKDTCRNPANIYDSYKKFDGDYEEYWMRIAATEDCTFSGESDCGICDYPFYSMCSSTGNGEGVGGSDNSCKDLTCGIVDGENRINSETWCVYESQVGESKDVVGSEHWLKSCEDGEVEIDDTQNKYRREICAETNQTFGNGEEFSIAQYRPNLWMLCSTVAIETDPEDLKEEERNRQECEDIPDCRVLGIDVSSDARFVFDMCVPKYPPGFDFSLNGNNLGEDICTALSDVTCTYVRKSSYFRIAYGTWGNTGRCLEGSPTPFVKQMNELCYSLGDCGGYINVEGEYTKNYETSGGFGGERPDDMAEDFYYGNQNPQENMDFPQYLGTPGSPGDYDDLEIILGEGADLEEVIQQSISVAGFLGGLIAIIPGVTGVVASIISIIPGLSSLGPPGLMFAAVLAIVALAISLFAEDYDTYPIKYSCEPWQAPVGGDDCEKCQAGDLPCTKYKCSSLGMSCKWISGGIEHSLCIDNYANDVTPPVIKVLNVSVNNQELQGDISDTGFKVTECIDSFSWINVTLKTENELGGDDHAYCMYDYVTVHWDDVLAANGDLRRVYSRGDGWYSEEHEFSEQVSTIHPGIYDLIPGVSEDKGKLNLNVRCMDPKGNSNAEEFRIEFSCITSKDETAPALRKFIPEDGSFIKHGETTRNLVVEMSEPVECKWGSTESVDFDSMAEEMNCFPSVGQDLSESGFPIVGTCSDEITGLTEDENIIYIRCRDTNGNTNTEDILYTFYASQNELNIDSVVLTVHNPRGDPIYDLDDSRTRIFVGGSYSSVDLDVKTSGGSEGGDAECKYQFENSATSSLNRFFNTGNTDRHNTVFTSIPSGDHDLKIICEDSGGNVAEAMAMFELERDSFPPKVVRVFNEGGKLKLITDEEARCYYANDEVRACAFDIDNSTSMSSVFTKNHLTNWNAGEIYFVKCIDLFDTVTPSCAITVNPV